MLKSVELASLKFFRAAFPNERFDYSDNKAKPLICAAFALYQSEWASHRFNIVGWQYPFDALATTGEFKGDEPWNVLFRRVMEIRAERLQSAA